MGNYPVLFTIEIYDEQYTLNTITGLIYANSFGEAAKTLEQYYGFSNIEAMSLEFFEDGIIELPTEVKTVEKIRKKLLGENQNEKLQ